MRLGEDRDGPVHELFGLSYASYFVMPRSYLQEMPLEWQERFCALFNEMDEALEASPAHRYWVRLKDERGRFVRDHYSDYRRGPAPPRRNDRKDGEG